MAKVGMIMGSDSDWPVMEPGYRQLLDMGVEVEVLVASAHRNPETVRQFAVGAEERGLKAIIAGAGMAAHLPGVVAAFTTLPVIGVPISGSAARGLDALLAIVQMPPGIAVATMAIDGGKNAGLYAAAILAAADPVLAAKLKDFRKAQAEGVAAKNAALQAKLSPRG
ncbi:5-(carboxyamino)imidazole ribonucleotide mutase [Deltaproteobacteria bacterium OttesenSCG-928-M10]|nr:5-(carboxyamino)imidazole ribonucleotide mutase [Deltaproteobacteria bacterium OttesenSCG-928-M10]